MSFDSNSSDQSFISIPSSTASFHSMDNPTRGNFRPNIRAGALALERIQEVSADIEQQRTDRRPVEEPFGWAEMAGPACKLAREALNRYRDHKKNSRRHEHTQWETRRNEDTKPSHWDAKRDQGTGRVDTSKIPMRKYKDDNPALRLLAEHQERQRTKRIKELKREGTTSFEFPGTPLPAYAPKYKIPEDIYEELEFKRLNDRLYTGYHSDPEAARLMCQPGKAYPSLPQEDYDYVQFGGIRKWAQGADEPKNKRKIFRKRLSPPPPTDTDDDSDENYAKIAPRSPRPVLRLRGGAGSSSGSPSGTPSTIDRKRKQTEGNDFNDHELLGEKRLQRAKTSTRICATMDDKPGMDATQIRLYLSECREIDGEFNVVLNSEKEKKKISVKSFNDLQAIRLRYQDLVDDLIAENSLLAGRLMEARTHKPYVGIKQQKATALAAELASKPKKPAMAGAPVAGGSKPTKTMTYAERVRFREPITTDTEATATSDQFTVVRRKKNRKPKNKKQHLTSGTDSGTETRSKVKPDVLQKKAKAERLKKIEPPKTFTVGVGTSTVGDVKKTLWSDLLKKLDAPNIVSTRVMPKEVLASTLAIQNSVLGLSSEEAIEGIEPSFKRGPPNKETVHWVCLVKPEVMSKIAGKKVFLGMSCCRITEYFDYNQCFKCLQYGHREKFCVSMFTACYHCAEKSHTGKDCPNKERPSKCYRECHAKNVIRHSAMTSNQAYQLTELRIVQHNLNGQHIVVEQLRDYCIDNRVDIALIQEFPSKNKTIKGLDHDPIRCIVGGTGQKPGAAIIVFNAGLEVTVLRNLSSDYFTVITVSIGREIINFVSSYFKFNISTVEFVMKLDAILNELKGETVICADVNAHSPLWMCDASNNTARVKGRKIEDLIERHHLTVHNNNRRTYTYNRVGMGKSNVDVTMTTARLAARITRWKVTKGITDSDHRVITFGLRHSKTVRGGPDTTRFNTDKADWDEFNVNLARELGQATDLMRGDVDVRAAALTAAVRSAVESSIPRKRGLGRLAPPWWNDDLTKSRKVLNNFCNTKDYKVTDGQEYQRLRNKHLGLIRHSQATDLMRGDVDVRAAALTAAIRSAAESSIPRKRGPGRLPPPWWNDDLTKSRKSLNNFRNTKDYKVTDRQEYQRLRNKHLGLIRHSKFQMWKSFAESANDKVWGNLYKWVKKGPRTNKVLTALKKDDDTYTTSYLETAEYLLSSLIPTDKDAVPLGRDEIAVSTDTTVELQDVKDAIWRIGVKKHAELSIGTATAKCNLTRGCPQGSQLGPILWNLSMDRALKLHRHDRSKIVAYADDLAVVTAGTNINIVRDRLSPMLDRLVNWASERGLSFSPMKTNVMTLKGGLKPGYSINFGNSAVISCSPIRYLGIQLDYKRTFWDHILYVGRKSEDMYTRLRTAYASTWGEVSQESPYALYAGDLEYTYGDLRASRKRRLSNTWRLGRKIGVRRD
ncbi:Endonuclease/exonuclease/phosphatase,Reverse transcriptase domain,Zinc finger, CCHC-type [Cinara cedri]|uniref:Endonuclease/exonuclease/phosphatase,Reverse transcriptase domain,Zinc finger, CCHC-type n=1 Tax=Cinara cedri TaxID=506608 RepID=A0A5E4MWB1_9HEMI|nr:Endonuclease/exonuclease/phosphatase,Reverse transcriptase domain,Zinc finger, CCHC-type [Cinara cedri]